MSQHRKVRNDNTKISYDVVRVIINRTDVSEEVLNNKVPELTEDLESCYNTESPNYVGKFESTEYKKLHDAWIEQGSPIEHFTYTDEDVLSVLILLGGLESLPMSFYEDDCGMLVIGPYSRERIDAMLQNFDKK